MTAMARLGALRLAGPLVAHPARRHVPAADRGPSALEAELAGLLASTGNGDQAAFASFYDATSRTIFAMALDAVADSRDAEAVTKDTYLAAWASAPTFDPSHGNPTAWLSSIANRIISLSRARR
jgi:RNA polymerase sigma-70 factor, ECF subfamily